MDIEINEQEIDELVHKAQEGGKESFGRLYDLFLDPIYRFFYFRLSSEREAEDLTSDTFFRALKSINVYKKQKSMPFSAWLFRIAKNILIDHYRKKTPTEELLESYMDESLSADSKKEGDNSINRQRILVALKELPEMQSQSIILRYFSDRKNSEIASILDKSETAVRILQSRGIKRLKEILEGNTEKENRAI